VSEGKQPVCGLCGEPIVRDEAGWWHADLEKKRPLEHFAGPGEPSTRMLGKWEKAKRRAERQKAKP